MRVRSILPAALLCAASCASLPAQSPTGALSNWRIDVENKSPLQGEALSAELLDMHRQKVASADLVGDAFVFSNVAGGQYTLVVTDGRGTPLYQQLVTAMPDVTPTLRLPDDDRERAPSGPVSVHELQHPPSPKALRAIAAARKFAQAGNYQKAVEQLQTAIRISPDYPPAHTNLAAQFVHLGRYEEAAAESQRALDLGSPNPLDLCNLAYAQIELRRFPEATASARRCLELAPDSPSGHYLLGTVLSFDRRTLPEAIAHLEMAVRSFPAAQAQLDKTRRALDENRKIELAR